MNYYLVITPEPLVEALLSESKRLMRLVYHKEVDTLFFRVKTSQAIVDPKRLFIKGDGRIIEGKVQPHISLLHSISLDEIGSFVEKAQHICAGYSPMKLIYDGLGNYDMDFTFFINFKPIQELEALRHELLEMSKPYMTEEEYQHSKDAEFLPHATVLYDDIDPEKVRRAYDLLDRSKFSVDVPVNEVVLWEVTPEDQKAVARFKLGGDV